MAAQLRNSFDQLSMESARREDPLQHGGGVLAVDQHMRITFCNESFARVTGIPVPIPQRAPLLEVVRDAGTVRHAGASVSGSKIRLEQALVNLLDNAIKFNRPFGEVRIDITRVPERRVCIMVADTGIGILSGVLSRIFERFYRVHKARFCSVGGTFPSERTLVYSIPGGRR